LGAYGRGLLLLVVLGGGVALSTALAAVATATQDSAELVVDIALRVAGGAASIGVNAALLMLAYRLLTAFSPPLRQLWPGALTAALLWELLLQLGTYLVGHELRGASATYGLFGIVLGLLSWLYLGALVLLLGAEINTVRAHRLYPRSLLALDPSNQNLTLADRRAYTSYASTERQKSYQTVHSAFTSGKNIPHPRQPDRDSAADVGEPHQ
jgi:uncharacterized BrkB/YihY/UPF0761 family membrane protein